MNQDELNAFRVRYQPNGATAPVELVFDHRKTDWAKVADRARDRIFPDAQPRKEKPWTSKRAR